MLYIISFNWRAQLKTIKFWINEIRHKIEIQTSGTEINFLYTWGTRPDIGPAGERKGAPATKPDPCVYPDMEDVHAPRREIEDQAAHRIHWRNGIFDHRMAPHAPLPWRVGVERCWRGQTTRQLSPRSMTETALAPLVFTKIPEGKGRWSPRSLCIILSLSGAEFVSALWKNLGKTERAPGDCVLFCRFRGVESLIHCAHCG